MAEETKKLSDRIREVLDTLVEALEQLLSPPPAPVPVRARRPRLASKSRR